MRQRVLAPWAAAALLALLLACAAAPAAGQAAPGIPGVVLPDPCFSCMERPTCAFPEPKVGEVMRLQVDPSKQTSPPSKLPEGTPALLEELSKAARTFTLEYKRRAFLEVNGRQLILGNFNANKSVENFHLFDMPVNKSSSQPRIRAIVELRCRETATEFKLVRVVASSDAANLLKEDEDGVVPNYKGRPPPVNITFTYLIPTNKACGLPLCMSRALALPPGEYNIYKPPLARQECPGTFMSSPTCKSGKSELGLLPLGTRFVARRQWRISTPAAAEAAAAVAAAAAAAPAGAAQPDLQLPWLDDDEQDLVGQPVVIQSVARAAIQCNSWLASDRGCSTKAAPALAEAPEQWLIEPGPPGPAGRLVTQYYIRSKAVLDAGCRRTYLCMKLSCDVSALQLCNKDEAGYSTLWIVRPTDLPTTLARAWGLS